MQSRYFFVLSSISMLLFGINLSAQDHQPGKKQKKEIIIHEGSDSSQKMVVVINGDKVTVNGKNYNGDEKKEFIIMRRKNEMMPPGAFIIEDNSNVNEVEDPEDLKKASLGVLAGKDEKGAIILEIIPGSAAEKAGLNQNDLIISIDGKKIDGPEQLSETIKSKNPSDKVEIQYVRDGKTKSTTAIIETRKAISKSIKIQKPGIAERNIFFDDIIEDEMERNGFNKKSLNAQPKLGIEIEEMDDDKGVKITNVEKESTAEKSGLKNGDIILSIDNQKTTNVADAKSAVRGQKPVLHFNLLRDGKPFQVEVKMPKILKKATL